LVGIAGAGKSTIASAWDPSAVLSLDALRGLVAGDECDQDATSDAVTVLDLALAARMRRRVTTVIDATNLLEATRAPLVTQAREWQVPAYAVLVDTPLPVARARNAARPGPAPGARWGRRVPEHVLVIQAALLADHPPTLREGFTAVHTINTAPLISSPLDSSTDKETRS
jgi:predicted kinase